MSELLKDIEDAESKLIQMDKLLKDTRKVFLDNDGVIEKDEEAKLKVIEGKIKEAEKKVNDLRKEYEKYAELWKTKTADFDRLKNNSAQLKEWKNPAAGDIEKSVGEIAGFEKEGKWKKAVEALEAAEKKAAKPCADVEKQTPLKLDFETQMNIFEKRYNKAKSSEYFSAKTVQDLIGPVDAALIAANASESERKYDKGLKDLETAGKALQKIEDASCRSITRPTRRTVRPWKRV